MERKVVTLSKAAQDSDKQIIYYMVSEPSCADTYLHYLSKSEIESMAHQFMKVKKFKLEHSHEGVGLNSDGQFPSDLSDKIELLENYIVPADLKEFHSVKLSEPLKAGSWVVGIKVNDAALWNRLKNTEHGISWGGVGKLIDRVS